MLMCVCWRVYVGVCFGVFVGLSVFGVICWCMCVVVHVGGCVLVYGVCVGWCVCLVCV